MYKKLICGVLTIILVFSLLSSSLIATAALEKSPIEFNFDIVFVIDNSGSMLTSDPYKTTLLAADLFVDMCGESNSRAGYVMYSHRIRDSLALTDISSAESRDLVKNKLNSTRYSTNEDTDIALGLSAAYNILRDGNALSGDRKPLIILLSDGNTDLPPGRPRTTEDSLAELESLKVEFKQAQIPVYSIGLNYDGTLDIPAMLSIADSTGALSYETNSADQLPQILSEIYANRLANSKIVPITTFKATGESQDVTIPIPNDSIYQANIIILSGKPVKINEVKNPQGQQVVVSQNNGIIETSTNVYTLLKLIRPQRGDWTLSMTGASGVDVTVGLLSTYDLKLDAQVSPATMTQGDTATFTASLSDMNGPVNDPTLFKDSKLTLTLVDTDTNTTNSYEMDSKTGSLQLKLESTGDYAAYITMNGTNVSRSSDPVSFNVSPFPLELLKGDHLKMWMISSLIYNTRQISISDMVSSYLGTNLNVTFGGPTWADHVKADYDDASQTVTLRAIKAGNTAMTVHMDDGNKQNTEFTVDIQVISIWIILLGLLGILLIIALLIYAVYKQNQPRLNDGSFGMVPIRVELPARLSGITPAVMSLTLPPLKGACSLEKILSHNLPNSKGYFEALQDISGYLKLVQFTISGKKQISVSTPPKYNEYRVLLNGTPKKTSAMLNAASGVRLVLTCSEEMDDQSYEIVLGEEHMMDDDRTDFSFRNSSGNTQSSWYDSGNDGFNYGGGKETGSRDGFGGFGGNSGSSDF